MLQRLVRKYAGHTIGEDEIIQARQQGGRSTVRPTDLVQPGRECSALCAGPPLGGATANHPRISFGAAIRV
ncbi:hypothetical protein D7I43_31305 [Micromonospora globbae]|uniref:Uncharacterized protein n=1 Tax=Micromonospora globbae TaxID=1894969 RepID=A0A420EQ65_9ACTN|nr:hypothetical protein D7I43_31305 [Micromonospora globbae]